MVVSGEAQRGREFGAFGRVSSSGSDPYPAPDILHFSNDYIKDLDTRVLYTTLDGDIQNQDNRLQANRSYMNGCWH
jgi:hypothetical protein